MSFFSDVLESIGGDKAPAPPPKIQRPPSANLTSLNRITSGPGTNATFTPQTGTKRKAEDDGRAPGDRIVKPNPAPGLISKMAMGQRQVTTNGFDRSRVEKSGADSSANTKTPAKGSYADILARARAAQEQRGRHQVGIIKHQKEEKAKESKLIQRRKEEDERKKRLNPKHSPRPGPTTERQRSASSSKKPPSAITKIAKPMKSKPVTGYKGTMGLSARQSTVDVVEGRHSNHKKRLKYDECLGTDEEEDSDRVDDESEDAYGSDASSDMEAGFDDVYEEEQLALRQAVKDDAKEKVLEDKLKLEKEERKRKLQAMANRGKR